MRKIVLLMLLMVATFQMYAQDRDRKFDVYIFEGLGNAQVQNDYPVNYDLHNMHTGALFNYRFFERNGVGIGITSSDFTGNGQNQKGYFYNERKVLSIPLMYSITNKYEKLKWFVGVGVQANKLLKDRYSYIDGEDNKPFGSGWYWSWSGSTSFTYKVHDMMSLGVMYSGNLGLSKIASENDAVFKGKQKIKYSNQIGLVFNFSF